MHDSQTPTKKYKVAGCTLPDPLPSFVQVGANAGSPCWAKAAGGTAPDRLVGLVRVPELLLLRFVPGAPEVRRPVVHPATALRDPCTHHCSTHLVPAHAAASMHHSGSVGLASAPGAPAGCRGSRRQREVVSQAEARQTLSVQQDLELPGPTTAAAPRQQPACAPPERSHTDRDSKQGCWTSPPSLFFGRI